MPRLITLGWLLVPAAAFASDLPVLPAVPSGSLSQSLPSVVSGSLSTIPTVPPPVMVSQPAWGPPAATLPALNTPAWAAPVRTPQFTASRIQQRLHVPLATGCDARYSLLDRLRSWLGGGAGPAVTSGWVFAPPAVPLREWGWKDGPAAGAAGVPSPGGRFFGGGLPVIGPRPIRLPLPSAADCTAGRPRPDLLRRLLNFFSPGGGDCEPTLEYGGISSYGGIPNAPAFGGYSTSISSVPMLSPGSHQAASPPYFQPPSAADRAPAMPAQTGAPSGFHFAAPLSKTASSVAPAPPAPAVNATPVLPPISVLPPLPPSSVVPASATQPFTQKR